MPKFVKLDTAGIDIIISMKSATEVKLYLLLAKRLPYGSNQLYLSPRDREELLGLLGHNSQSWLSECLGNLESYGLVEKIRSGHYRLLHIQFGAKKPMNS